ncbi:hypothetical protein LC653_21580 [Nostoc sp. CHAB 5784]|uniref:hypothetical protein n=1 Tax=Nostoc mirabile TaxID=2907820 RepID=UPI001E5EBB28|nr:hypothetical protein [Nostoc mirabile]MCC5666437.1 hypothetical protein [Nostoc mirabile CHAB5784]
MTKKKDKTQPQENKVRDAVFHPEFREDLAYWVGQTGKLRFGLLTWLKRLCEIVLQVLGNLNH